MSPQQKFLKNLASSQSKEQVSGEYEVGITNLELDSQLLASNPFLGLVVPQVKATKISGNYTSDKKKQLSENNIQLKLLGSTLPITTISNENSTVLTMSSVTGFSKTLELFQGLTGGNASQLNSLSQAITTNGWETNYISVNDAVTSTQSAKEKVALTAKEEKTLKSLNMELAKEMMNYFKTVDKTVFVEKDEILTMTLNKKEFQGLFSRLQKVLADNKEYQTVLNKTTSTSALPISADTIKALADSNTYKDYEKLELAIGINQKNQDTSFSVILSPKDSTKQGIKTIQLEGTLVYTKFKGTPKFPTKEQIITTQQLSEAMNSASKK